MDGGQEFDEIRDALAAAKAELAKIETQRADLAVPPVIALHPDLAGDYRRRVANLRELLQGGSDETRREALNEVRNLIDRIVVAPSSEARGVSIELEGRLNAVLELAAGATPTASPAMYVNGGAACATRTDGGRLYRSASLRGQDVVLGAVTTGRSPSLQEIRHFALT